MQYAFVPNEQALQYISFLEWKMSQIGKLCANRIYSKHCLKLSPQFLLQSFYCQIECQRVQRHMYNRHHVTHITEFFSVKQKWPKTNLSKMNKKKKEGEGLWIETRENKRHSAELFKKPIWIQASFPSLIWPLRGKPKCLAYFSQLSCERANCACAIERLFALSAYWEAACWRINCRLCDWISHVINVRC